MRMFLRWYLTMSCFHKTSITWRDGCYAIHCDDGMGNVDAVNSILPRSHFFVLSSYSADQRYYTVSAAVSTRTRICVPAHGKLTDKRLFPVSSNHLPSQVLEARSFKLLHICIFNEANFRSPAAEVVWSTHDRKVCKAAAKWAIRARLCCISQ